MEGYCATGNRSCAKLIGTATAETFEEACVSVLASRADLQQYYNAQRNTVWGCRLFPTEGAARASFG